MGAFFLFLSSYGHLRLFATQKWLKFLSSRIVPQQRLLGPTRHTSLSVLTGGFPTRFPTLNLSVIHHLPICRHVMRSVTVMSLRNPLYHYRPHRSRHRLPYDLRRPYGTSADYPHGTYTYLLYLTRQSLRLNYLLYAMQYSPTGNTACLFIANNCRVFVLTSSRSYKVGIVPYRPQTHLPCLLTVKAQLFLPPRWGYIALPCAYHTYGRLIGILPTAYL